MFLTTLPSRSSWFPKRAMILAAGKGIRMLPLTERIPKPMLVISGKTLLDMAIERLLYAGVKTIVINASHLADKIVNHIEEWSDNNLIVTVEDEPLETGGGVLRALPFLGDDAFFVINGDSVWIDGMKCPLLRLAEAWDPDRMDVLLMLARLSDTFNFDGFGDFLMDQNGRLRRRRESEVVPYAYMGLSIISPKIFSGFSSELFSLNRIYDLAIDKNRLFGIAHDGLWYHISTPVDLELARSRFANGHTADVPFF